MDQKTISCQVAIIGGGPGGYVAAIKAATQGKDVVLIEKGAVGGTCLNVGCIPTKTYIADANFYTQIQSAKAFGIEMEKVTFNFSTIFQKKNALIASMRKNLENLIRSHKVKIIYGHARFISAHELEVEGKDAGTIIADTIIIASGSSPFDIPNIPYDYKTIHNSTTILNMAKLPKTLTIIGGGYIGCEFASIFSTYGVKVTIVEAMDSILSFQEPSIRNVLTKAFQRKEIKILTNTKVEKVKKTEDRVTMELSNGQSIESEQLLVAIGRKLNTDLNLEKAGVKQTDKGAIPINDKMQTNIEHIYAVGDITGGLMLAHVASHQAAIAVKTICGKKAEKFNPLAVPAIIYTIPEIACVGLTATKAKELGYDFSVGKFPFQALGISLASSHTEGFAEMITDNKTGRILGAHVVGYAASSLIAEITLAITNNLTVDDIINTIHAHPSLPEIWHDAAHLAKGEPLHLPPARK